MNKEYLLVIDEGTTGVRGIVFDRELRIISQAYRNLEVYYPGPNEVEESGEDIYEKTVTVCREAIQKAGIEAGQIAACGLTNQRYSWMMWNKVTGKPLRNAVVWLDNRVVFYREKWINDPVFREKFPQYADSISPQETTVVYEMICGKEPAFAEASKSSDALYGGIDAWVIWKLTGGRVHAMSSSSCSAMGKMFSMTENRWDADWLGYVGLTTEMMPEVKEEADDYGVIPAEVFGAEIPILGVIADQQSALFAQDCVTGGTVKLTNGTGAFADINMGEKMMKAGGLGPGIAWTLNGRRIYLVEGMFYTIGSCLEWVKNNAELVDSFDRIEEVIGSVEDSAGVYFVPAFSGYQISPKNDASAKGAFLGLSGGVTKEHMLRAAMEGLAFASASVLLEAQKSGLNISSIKVSGGVSKSDFVNQLIANVMDAEVVKPSSVEATAMGAAEMAAIRLGWITEADIGSYMEIEKTYLPNADAAFDRKHYDAWFDCAKRVTDWKNWPLD